MEWFKFYAEEYLSDMKIRSLPPLHQHCWTYILALAASEERNGFIPFLDEETLMSTAGLVMGTQEWESTEGVLKLLESRKMITIETEGITVTNWVKKQGSALSSYERVKRFREKKRNETERNAEKHENDNNRIEENRINTPADAGFSKNIEEVRLDKDGDETSKKKKDPANNQYEEICEWAVKRRGFKFVSKGKQFAFLKKAKAEDISISRLKERWMKQEGESWREGKIDWGTVISSFDKEA